MFTGIENDGLDRVIMDYDLKRYHDTYLTPVSNKANANESAIAALQPGGDVLEIDDHTTVTQLQAKSG